MGISCDIVRCGSTQIGSSTSAPIDIINNRYIINYGRIMYVAHIIVAHVDTGNAVAGTEGPVVCGRPVTAEGDADIHPWAHGCPAIVTAIFAPGDPGRGPFIAGRPHPSVGIVVEPVAIMKRRPAPAIAGNPDPAFVCINPMSAGAVGAKAAASCRYPYIPIIRIIHPGAIRAELIIKDLEADAGLSLGLYLTYAGNKACK